MGLSQQALGARVEITFQQLQKYEAGVNRVSAGRLYRLAQVLDVNMSYFFEGADSNGDEVKADGAPLSRETLELVRAYHAIESSEVRGRLYDFVKALGES